MKRFFKFFAVAFLSLTFAACKKELTDLKPIDLIPADRAILNMTDLASAVNGVYGTYQARRSHYISSFISDEGRLGFGTEYRNVGNALFNWQFVSDSQDWRDAETGGVWTNLYQVIDRANRVIEFSVNVPATTAADIALKNQYLGEMYGIRAMCHLELLRNFSITPEYTPAALGVVNQTSYVKNPATYRPARNTQLEVMTQIDADLATARNLIPATFTDISRITRNAVIGAQTRAAVHIKNWQGVVDRATEVLALQPISTGTTYDGIFTTRSLASTQATEVIWKYNVNSSNAGFAVGSLWQDANGAQQLAPSQKLVNQFNQVTDRRFALFLRTTPRNLIAKYGVVPPTGETFLFDIKLMRSSEILLARAEAYAELSNFVLSNADLNTLRAGRITGYVNVNLPDRTTLIDAIYTERYKELCFEGQRYYDLRRRSFPINRDVADIGGIPTSQNLPPTDAHYIIPIPIAEIQANPSIVQNVGY